MRSRESKFVIYKVSELFCILFHKFFLTERCLAKVICFFPDEIPTELKSFKAELKKGKLIANQAKKRRSKKHKLQQSRGRG